MPATLIGQWVTRNGLTVSHLVESEVAGDIVTHCGRRLRPRGGEFHLSYLGVEPCAYCSSGGQPTGRHYPEPGEDR